LAEVYWDQPFLALYWIYLDRKSHNRLGYGLTVRL
jgi:hypothetical protein